MSKFDVDEKVLCYEPDLNKRRVLYNAKVSCFNYKGLMFLDYI